MAHFFSSHRRVFELPVGAPEIDPGRILAFDRRIKSIEQAGYKFIWYSDGTSELYHISEDPSEESNIISEYPDIASDLDKKLQEWLISFQHREKKQMENARIDRATRENLKALGYLP